MAPPRRLRNWFLRPSTPKTLDEKNILVKEYFGQCPSEKRMSLLMFQRLLYS
jgi:hypothetical protein